MSQYQRMVSYLYEYKQGVKGVNVGYVRIEQRGAGCRISLQMRSRNLGQLSDVAVFRQRRDGIRYYTIGKLTEKNGDYRCRIQTESENLMGSGINLSNVDGIVLYQNNEYYIATTWKNQSVYLGENRIWDPAESEESEELENVESEFMDEEPAKSEEIAENEQSILEQSDMHATEQSMSQQASKEDESGIFGQKILEQSDIERILREDELEYQERRFFNGDEQEHRGQRYFDGDGSERREQQYYDRDGLERREQRYYDRDGSEHRGQQYYGRDGSGYRGQQFFPRWNGMPLFRRRLMGNGNIPIPQMAEWSNGNRHMAESGAENRGNEGNKAEQEPSVSASSRKKQEQMEEQAVCRNCPFKRKEIDYGKRILMTFPVMRPFPNDQQMACVRIEPQDLGCLPMQMWTLANNHFLLQGYYCYRHLIFMETGKQEYALGVPGIYDRRTSRQAEQFGFVQFRAICSGKQCEGAFGYWIMPLSC